jgi:hypothetical protein
VEGGDNLKLRDAVEDCLRGWDAGERSRARRPIITYDMTTEESPNHAPLDAIEALQQLNILMGEARAGNDDYLWSILAAHASFLRNTLGERQELRSYICVTQGCNANGWSEDYIHYRGEMARELLKQLGVPWGKSTQDELEQLEGLVDPVNVPQSILHEATAYEGRVRELAATSTDYDLEVQLVSIEAYWSYWLDGKGKRPRLRFNDRRTRMTKVRAKQFALHEVLGHALQCATWSSLCTSHDVAWARLLSLTSRVHVAFEGLAQALPLLLPINDIGLEARVRLDHYLQLVRSQLHLMIESGKSIEACVSHARKMVPFWSNDMIAEVLADRGLNPSLRSYLWTYPAGFDWFVALAETGDRKLIESVTRANYQAPLSPSDLKELWPGGPTIGGPE